MLKRLGIYAHYYPIARQFYMRYRLIGARVIQEESPGPGRAGLGDSDSWISDSLAQPTAALAGDKPAKESGSEIQTMQAKIGQLTLENDFLEKALSKAGMLSARR
jgi:hypothetical protein